MVSEVPDHAIPQDTRVKTRRTDASSGLTPGTRDRLAAPGTGADTGGRGSPTGRLRLGRVTHAVRRDAIGYVAAVLGPAVALAVTAPIADHLATFPLTILLIAVTASAYLGGAIPGLLATVLAVAGAELAFTEPNLARPHNALTELVRLGLFLAAGAVISTLSEQLRRARARAERTAVTLEERNATLSAQAIELEMQQQQLADQAVELETTNEQLAEHSAELERANDELQLRAAELEEQRAAEHAARARTERLQALTATLTSRAPESEILGLIAHEAASAFGARAGAVALLEDQGAHLRFARWFGYPDARIRARERIPLQDDLPLPVAVREQRAIWASTPAEIMSRWPHFADATHGEPTGAIAAVPLTADEHSIGALLLSFPGPRGPGDDLTALQSLAHLCAQAIQRARLREAERKAAERTMALQSVTEAFAQVVARDDVARVALERGLPAASASAGMVLVPSSASVGEPPLVVLRHTSYALTAEGRLSPAPDVDHPAYEVAQTGRPLWLESSQQRDALAVLPLSIDTRVLGVVVLGFAGPREFPPAERAFLEAIARQCAQALDRARLYEAEHAARADAERARADAEAASQAKGQFLTNMSHELRTPLNAIAGHVQLVAMGVHGPVTKEQEDALDRVGRAQRHLLGLINDVLNYAKLERGRVEFSVQPADLGELVADVVPMIEPQLAGKQIAYETRVPPGVHRVWADSDKLRQVLINLLANAVKFTPAGGSVTVEVATREATPELLYLRVVDTGIGIARDKQDALFEPFVQVHRSLRSAAEGTGLGLAISRELARGMGGDLRVRSDEGVGSRFTIALRRV